MALANASQSVGVRCLQALQQRLGLLPELFEIGAGRQLPCHGNLLPFVACVRTPGRKKICQIVAVELLWGGLGPFRGPDAPRAPKSTLIADCWRSQWAIRHSTFRARSQR